MKGRFGKVYLTGAGCGGPELLTLRALRLISGCGCLVYDDLIYEGILALAPPEAERISVGKRAGRHSMRQEEINSLLIDCAGRHELTVRLKGGDPFVFGRGGEEFLALSEAGIECELVPGISSAVAIPELAGIPVTHRELSRSFHVVTAHTSGGGLPEDLPELAKLHGTLVFLMGLGRLEALAAALVEAGMDAGTPAAVVSGGNAKKQLCVRGTLADIARRAREAGAEAPAVIVVGPTAALKLRAAPGGPLAGVRVALTGTESFQRRLRERLEPLGAIVLRAASTRLIPLDFGLSPGELHDKSGWLVFTSANGVELALERLIGRGLDLRRLGGWKLAAIGPATAAALRRFGLCADLVPGEHTTAALKRELKGRAAGEAVLLLRSRLGAPELRGLPGARDIPVYDVETAFNPVACDYLVLGSAHGAREYFASCPVDGFTAVCLGPVTAAAVPEAAKKITAGDISADGVAASIVEDFSARAL